MDSQLYDFIIIGAGAAGLAAGQYGARSGLKTLVIDLSTAGGQALTIADLENYPGVYPSLTGADFIHTMEQQTLSFGAQILQTQVLSIDKIGSTFILETNTGKLSAYALLVATGAIHKQLGVPGEKELAGSGVSYCATCDGPFFKDKKIIVVGGGDAACDEACYLATLSSHVTLLHRRAQLRAQKAVADKLLHNEHITVRYNTAVKEIKGNHHVESVTVADAASGTESELAADAVFIFVGIMPCTSLVPMLQTDDAGYIITDNSMKTAIPGLYCAGDVRSKPFRQLITAASDGAIAAHEAEKYVQNIKQKTGASR